VHGPQNEFVVKESSIGELNGHQSGGKRVYVHSIERIDPPSDGAPIDRVIKLERSKEIVGKLVDEQGQAIDDALVITRLNILPNSLEWRGDYSLQAHDGRFTLSGAAPNQEYDVYFLDATHRLGAAAKLRSDSSSPTIVLKACGEAIARFKDATGEPITNYVPSLEMVVTPGASSGDPIGSLAMKAGMPTADADFVANIDRKNYWPGPNTDKNGLVTLPALIPGAQYRLIGDKKGPQMLTVEAHQTIDLGTLVVEQRK
jgi:hypothetical protein